ncbi:DUF1715-domain-containing protein [Meredithblackwellia eburnea MCA 4105]
MDDLVALESNFYDQGFSSGLPHGELHGLFEGRQLGREHSWQIWEEVGYYEGMAILWKHLLISQGKTGTRAFTNIETLLTNINLFPLSNNSSSLSSTTTATMEEEEPSQPDITELLTSIRTKYRTVCAGLGVRPRMVAMNGSGKNGEGRGLDKMSL